MGAGKITTKSNLDEGGSGAFRYQGDRKAGAAEWLNDLHMRGCSARIVQTPRIPEERPAKCIC